MGNIFLKPKSSLWLYLESVCRQVIEQFEVLNKYFITNLRITGMILLTASTPHLYGSFPIAAVFFHDSVT